MFWERFYEACIAHNTKPNPVAKEIGVSSGLVTKWKTTGILPNGEILIKIADRLDCSTDYLLGRTNTASDLSPQEQQLVDAFRAVSRQGREYLLQQAAIAQEIYKNSNSVSNVETQIG